MMFADEEGIHFDVGKFWDNDVSTVLQRWENKVGDGEVERAIKDILVRWEEYANKVGNDTASKIESYICGETISKGVLFRQFLFVEIKGGEMESFLDSVVSEIREEEQKSADELDGIRQEPAPDPQTPEYLTDEYCLKRLADTGFIMINKHAKNEYDENKYIIKLGHSALDIFGELAKITGSERRARSIMIQYMPATTATLNTHRPKHSLKS